MGIDLSAWCQPFQVHYGEHAASKDLGIDDLKVSVEGKFRVSRPRSFSEITYFVDIRSPERIEKIKELASISASDCYITNTLSRACQVTGSLKINGNDAGEIRIA